MSLTRWQKLIFVPVLILVLLGPILAPFAESFNFPDRYDLTAILVEQGLYADANDYDGLLAPIDQNHVGEVPFGAPIERTNIKARIDRYATDLQNALPGTRALIIQVDRFEQPASIMGVLERLHFEGDPKEPGRIAYLKGVVVVGEVPLPIVNKKGNRFISMFPYTDFDDRAYVWNPATQDFEIREDNPNPQPEVWHGVIRPPVSTQTPEGKEMLAAYFDKNHLYHLGDPAYANFNRRVFFQDFWEEQKNLNAIMYKNYLKFLEHQGDIAYMRYTRELYKDLIGPVEEEIAQDEADAKNLTDQLAAMGIPSDSSVPPADIPSDAPDEVKAAIAGNGPPVDKNAIPDIQTKIGKMSDPLMARFKDLFPKYPSLINDFIKYTGRYLTPVGDDYKLGVDSAVNLITAKDKYTLGYLKAVNTMMEDAIDGIVNELQQPIQLAEVKVKALSVTRRSDDVVIDEDEVGVENVEASFVNYTPAFSNDGNDFPDRLNGLPKSTVTSVARCTPYRGSNGSGPYSKLVEINRALNQQSGSDYHEDAELITGRTAAEKGHDYQCHFEGATETCEGYEHFAGCFYDNKAHLFDDPPAALPNPQVCFPEHATDPVLEQRFYPNDAPVFLGAGGTQAVTGNPPPNYDNFRSCLDFYEKEQYIEYLKSVDNRLEELSNDENYDNSRDERIGDMLIHPLEPKDKHPNNIILFKLVGDPPLFETLISVTLTDVLRGLGWDFAGHPQDWKATLVPLLRSPVPLAPLVVSLAHHPVVSNVTVQLTRVNENPIPISSVMYHKEPTNETLFAQGQNFITQDLPVDNPRYMTFQNLQHEVSTIVYPELFSEATFENYLTKLRAIQDQLNDPELRPDGAPAPCDNCLLSLISNAPEIAAYPPKKDVLLSRANFLKVMDALNWKNMDIDSKHQYMSEYYLDPRDTKNAYVGESLNGYEMAYFNGEGAFDRYEFALNKDIPEEDEEANLGSGGPSEKDEPYVDDPRNSFDFPPPGTDAEANYDLFSWSPPPVSPWWVQMQKWQEELKQTVSEFEFGLSAEEFYGGLEEENKKALEDTKKESSDVEANLRSADDLDFSKVATLVLETDSNTLVTSKQAQVKISLKDKDGKLVNDEFSKITLSLEGDGRLNTENEITMMSGAKMIGVVANENPTTLKLTAQIADTEKKAELTLSVVQDAHLHLESPILAVIADGQNDLAAQVFARDANNQTLTNVNGVVKVGVSDPVMGQVTEKEIRLLNGQGNFHFKAGKKSGKILLSATSGALDPGNLELTLLPGAPKSLGLTASSDTLPALPGSQVQIFASLFDENGNMVNTNSAQVINFHISAKTEVFGVLSSAQEITNEGVATVTLSPRDKTGPVSVIAESPGLTSAALTLRAVKQFGKLEVSAMRPEALTVSLLGIPAGNVAQSDYLGGWFTMNGKVQAANSLTAQPTQYNKLFEISDRGGVSIPDPARISAQFIPANNFTMVLKDNHRQLDIAQVSLITLKEGQFEVTEEADPEKLADGIYVKKIAPGDAYKVDKVKGALRLVKGDQERAEVQTNGFTRIFDNDFTLRPREGKFLIIQIIDKDTPVAEIFFVQRFDQDVKIQSEISSAPGVYVQPLRLPPQFIFENTFLGNSSAQPKGAAFFDKSEEVQGASAPGFAFQSLEDSKKNFGIGFTQGNKFALLFSSGETFGEANRPYASDIGIVLGDPTVRIDNRKAGTFSADIGKLVSAGAASVRGLVTLDYNNDGNEDILILEGENKIRLIQNNGGYDQLKDQGYLFDIKNGIQDFTKLDFNNDGQMDLVIAGKVSCRKGDTCIDVYENRAGAFVRHNLRFDQQELVTTVRAEDLNRDDFTDLVIGDTAGDVKVLYNRRGVFDRQAQVVGNVGVQVDPNKNLISSVLVRYSGMTTKNPDDPDSMRKYFTLGVKVPNPEAAEKGFGGVFGGANAPQVAIDEGVKYEAQDFMYVDFDTSTFVNSTKFGEDLNGGVVKSEDVIRYTITLKNDSGAIRRDVAVSDIIGESLGLDKASIRCTDCPQDEMQIEDLNGHDTRPYLFKNIDIPAHASRHIVYDATFQGDTDTAPKITLAFNNRFTDEDNERLNGLLQQDDYFDIAVSKEGNPTGQLRYYFTTGVDGQGSLGWDSELSSPPRPVTAESLAAKTGLHIPKPEDFMNIDEECIFFGSFPLPHALWNDEATCRALGGKLEAKSPPESATNLLAGMQNDDSDGDGVQDSLDDVSGTLDDVAEATAAAVGKLTCNAGCIPLPLNMAFLSPGFFSVLGVPAAYDIGMPVFGWGAPSIIPTWPPMPSMSTLGGRFYISPAITGGVGFSLCLGPFGTPRNCFSFGINALDLLPGNICDKIQGGVNGALAAANSAISKANEGMTLTVGGGGSSLGSGSREASGSGLGNYSLGSYETPTAKSRNIRIPGFPSVITDWLARQWEEIEDKVLSIPDIYLIYPSLDSIGGSVLPSEEFSRTGDVMTNVLSWVNSIPLIDIETQEVLFKVPILTRKEIEKFKADWRQWIADERLELDKWRNLMGCVGVAQAVDAVAGTDLATDGNFGNLELCRFVTADMNNLINSLVANMEALDEWILFPKKVLQFRAIEAYYLGQIINYLDTIIQFTGGWMKKNTARLKQWRRAIRDIKDTIKNYKLLIKLMIEYNESCDTCKTERFSLKDLILKLFIAIPAPPVIPLPKLPDIVLDVSKIQAGLRIQWPDIKFKAEPFTIPRIPRIALGVNLTIPQFKLIAPKIPVIPKPPGLPILPPLPPLQLPKLPDLPPPPTMPALPSEIKAVIDILKKILKILCIIKMGFMPTDEFLLKTKIEEITARGLSPLLPIDLMFTVQYPPISVEYVDQIRVTAFTNLQLDFSAIQRIVAAAAEQANKFSTSLVSGANKYTDALSKQLEKFTSPTINIGPEGAQLNYKEKGPLDKEELTKELSAALGTDATQLVQYGLQLNGVFRSLSAKVKEHEKIIAAVPDKITLKAENIAYNPSTLRQAQGDILEEDLSLPFLKRLKTYRDHLVAYVDDSEELLEREHLSEEFEDLNRFLASQRSPFLDKSLKQYVAASDFSSSPAAPSREPVKIGPFDLENADWLPEDETSTSLGLVGPERVLENGKEGGRASALADRAHGGNVVSPRNRLLAFSLPAPPQLPGVPDTGGLAGLPTTQDRGIFFVDPSGEGRRLINYTLEVDSPSQLADIDIDNDDDFDKLYSYGGNVYLKKNDREEEEEPRPNFRPEDIEFWTIFELKPHGFSPNFPESVNEAAREASFTFEKSTTTETSSDIAGYEFVAKNSPFYFESPGATPTIRAHLLADPKGSAASVPAEKLFTLKDADGEVLIDGAVPTTPTAEPGNVVLTKENSSLTLVGSDGTVVRVAENAVFKIPEGGPFELTQGEIEIEIPQSGSAFFPPQTTLTVLEGEIRVRFFDGSDVKVTAGSPFILPEVRPLNAVLKGVYGSALFTGLKRDYASESDEKVRVKAGEMLHPLDVVQLKWNAGGSGERMLTLSKDVMIPVPDVFANGMDIEIDEGVLEIIRSEKTTQAVAAGMALLFGDEVTVNSGSVEVHYTRGGDSVIHAHETYSLNVLADFENPTATLALDPAFYFGKIYAFDSQGNRSSGSQKVLLAPQVCGDTTTPLANLGKAQYQVAVGKTLPLDASRSFDTMSRVISYFLDTDSAVDSDGDGIANNDRDLFTDSDATVDSDEDENPTNDGDSPRFVIGPYPEVGQKQMRLTVRDEGLNEGYQDILVDIITPRIVLNGPPLKSNIISGFVEPPEENVPITIARLRPGTSTAGWEIFKTPSADDGGQYFTNADGRFQITDADLRDRLVIRDSTGKIIAEVNTETGRMTITDDQYETRVIPATPPLLPTRVGLFFKGDPSLENPVTFTYFVPDVNTDAVIDDVAVLYNVEAVSEMSGMHVKPLARAYEMGFTFQVLPGNDTQLPGAVVAVKDGNRVVVFDVNGDILPSDPAVSFRVKQADQAKADDPVVFEMLYNGEVVAEIFIAAHLGRADKVQIIESPTPTPRPIPIQVPTGKKEFTDVSQDDPLKETLDKLSQRGIVAGYANSARGELLFKPENLINRAEFTLITEKMLCILPREEAKKLPTPFYDVLDPKLWFYPVLKEGHLRGFIRGYLGDARVDPVSGATQTPFRPAREITRAEAATVVLAALQEEDIIDMSKVDLSVKPGKNWFDPYIEVAQDLKPYLRNSQDSQRAFLITPEEAAKPNETITRRDFAVMAERVLLMYDCNNPDTDEDKLPDTWELAQGKQLSEIQPNDDPDQDQCTNAKEYEIGSDPFNADTDEGGVPDCTEIDRGTDPVRNPYDDRPLIPRDLVKNEEGIFILRPLCGDSCPCRATIGPGGDLIPGDILFAAITGHGGLPIYAKSNEERY